MRLFDYTLNMRSLNHQGVFFDNLNFSNFGYGGDPNDVSRLHIDKNKWYDFHLLFRRDKNFWDYNLLANPLNPASPNPVGSATSGCILSPPTSAHPGLPGYCSNPAMPQANSLHCARSGAPHAGLRSDALAAIPRAVPPGLFALPRRRRQLFHHGQRRDAGLPGKQQLHDERVPRRRGRSPLPRTTISYDQFLNYFKQDNGFLESPAATPQNYGYQLANGTPVDLGVVWSTQTPAEVIPCAAPIANAATTPPTANPNCNGFLSYSQVDSARNYMPTEQVRLQSNYFQKFEMTASVGYSRSDNSIPDFDEDSQWPGDPLGDAREHHRRAGRHLSGLGERGLVRRIRRDGQVPHRGFLPLRQLADSGHVGHRTKRISLALRDPDNSALAQPLSLFNQVSPTTAGMFAALCPVAPYNQVNCPLHTTSSGADVTNEITSQFLGQNLQSNTFQLQYDFTRRLSARLGYLYMDRTISQFSATWDTGETYFPGGVNDPLCSTTDAIANDYCLAARGDCACSSPAARFPPAAL